MAIRWHKPFLFTEENFTESLTEIAIIDAEISSIEKIILQTGIPVVEGAVTAREFAIELLKLAAEIEQALMVQYLYTATSLPNEPSAADSVNYHEKLMDIAIQEMGHLATVQNLLLLLGGRDAIYLQRDILRRQSLKNPIPFVLEQVSMVSLAKYVVAEKPAEIPLIHADKVAELTKIAEADAGIAIHRVGVIYEILKWIFTPEEESINEIDFASLAPMPDKPHLSEDDLIDLSEIIKFEALAQDEWEVFEEDIILLTVHTLSEAREAIARIAEQGEGLQDKDSSHFGEFMETVAAFEAGNIQIRPIAKSPAISKFGGEGGELISHPYTKLWGEVFSLHYSLLIVSIYHALVTPRSDEASSNLRNQLIRLALFSMRRIIGPLSDVLASLPLHEDSEVTKAGPPFDLNPSILSSNNNGELIKQHISMIDRLVQIYKDIRLSPDFSLHPDHSAKLTNLKNFDKRRRDLFA